MAQILEVTITVSEPYVRIGGGWTGLRPQGLRRDYKAELFGIKVQNTSKVEIQRRIRQLAYRETGSSRVKFNFVDEEA
ncbi:MAG: hypothetical protein WA708_13845 [Acidobacteriaceae bacterium]